MKVLWFTNTPSNYVTASNSYNGGGWISSLERELKKREKVELGISFLLNEQPKKVKMDGICYYPIHNPYRGSLIGKLRKFLSSDKRIANYFLDEYLRVINDFRPDIINIFGTEQDFGLIVKRTSVPVVIHLQGLINPCLMAFFPPGFNMRDYVWSDFNPMRVLRRYRTFKAFENGAERERIIFRNNKHFMGRTNWDKDLTHLLSPESSYDYCSEILRDEFYHHYERKLPDNLIITSTISQPLYKGYDIILKCAEIMSKLMKLDFEWRVYGDICPSFIEKKVGIRSQNVNVKLMGVASSIELRKSILESTLYVHPSYIDNSPNSVCEAQMMGCPVVGQFVGGMPTLVTRDTGILVPANDPFQMASAIRAIYENNSLNISMGQNAEKEANKRHNKQKVVNDLLAIYNKYVQCSICNND